MSDSQRPAPGPALIWIGFLAALACFIAAFLGRSSSSRTGVLLAVGLVWVAVGVLRLRATHRTGASA